MEYKFTIENFDKEVLESEIPVLVDFYADWCGPCKMMGPVLEEISKEFDHVIKVGKCDTEENMSLAQKYRVASIPNLQLFRDGQVIANYIGYMSKEELRTKLKNDLA